MPNGVYRRKFDDYSHRHDVSDKIVVERLHDLSHGRTLRIDLFKSLFSSGANTRYPLEISEGDIEKAVSNIVTYIQAHPRLPFHVDLRTKNFQEDFDALTPIVALKNVISVTTNRYVRLTDQQVDALANSNLVSLYLQALEVTDAQMKRMIQGLPNLQILELRDPCYFQAVGGDISGKLTDKWMEGMATLHSKMAYLECRAVGDFGLEEISKLKNLRGLSISCSEHATNIGMQGIGTLANLEELGIYGGNIKDDGYLPLAKCSKLKFLSITGDEIGEQTAQTVSGLGELERLAIISPRLSDVCAQHLAHLPSLRLLEVGYGGVMTAKGLAYLANNPELSIDVIDPSRDAGPDVGNKLLHTLAEVLNSRADMITSVAGRMEDLINPPSYRPDQLYVISASPAEYRRHIPAATALVDKWIGGIDQPNPVKALKLPEQEIRSFLSQSLPNIQLKEEDLNRAIWDIQQSTSIEGSYGLGNRFKLGALKTFMRDHLEQPSGIKSSETIVKGQQGPADQNRVKGGDA